MDKEKNNFMQEAILLSMNNIHSLKGGPFGSVIVKDGKIIARGSNEVTSSNDPTAHAEVVAIRNAAKELGTYDLKDCEIYSSCEPCPMCLSAIYWSRIGKVYFANTKEDAAAIGFDDAFIYKEIAVKRHERTIASEQIMRDEALEVFKEWEKFDGKTHY